MNRPTCETCLYWYDIGGLGACRRHAPQPTNVHSDSILYVPGEPKKLASEWCGEHPDFPLYVATMKAIGKQIEQRKDGAE